MTVYTLDFEFHEEPRTVIPISIGLVAADGREYYAEWAETLTHIQNGLLQPNDFVREHVLPMVTPLPKTFDYWWGWWTGERFGTPIQSEEEIVGCLIDFLNPEKYGKPEIWGYFADYDWVLFCQTFGRMVDLPEGYPSWCRDIKQEMEARHLSRGDFPQQEKEHHALEDARWNMTALKQMMGMGPLIYPTVPWVYPIPRA